MALSAMWIMIGVLAVLAVAYRFYSAFLAAKVACLDDSRITPAHSSYDGQNYHPTNRWVLFGHHFAAISGAGPLIGPVLALQFGYLPGLIWLVVGVCLAGAVQDFLVLAASTRRGGESLAGIARRELGPVAGMATTIAILYVVIIALAGLGIVVVKALGGEEITMAAESEPAAAPRKTLVLPPGAALTSGGPSGTSTHVLRIPQGSIYHFGSRPGDSLRFEESYALALPAGATLAADPDGQGFVLPPGAKRLVPGSAWGTFTIACTIPIALGVGWYMYRFRKGKVVEASILGAIGVLGATILGAWIPGSPLEPFFSLSKSQTTYAIAAYGFIASVLPVWLLLCPRDYLSSFLKIGTIALLVVGVVVANPTLEAPAVNQQFAAGGGPNLNGPIFPYVFICIMCGAISGFHALVSSGTTPKMVDRESDCRPIGYGAMLIEGLVGVVALIAAASLPSGMYYDINIDLARKPQFAQALAALNVDSNGQDGTELVALEKDIGESLHGRSGGAVTLAVGMSRIMTKALPAFDGIIKYWYHFAIMFEALFILTTIDTGTRIGRFLVQEFLGKVWKPLGNLDWFPAAVLATALTVGGWSYFILTGTIDTIWPMFGLANQLLALTALAVVSAVLINEGKRKYLPVTILPMLFVASTTLSAAYGEITGKYLPWISQASPSLRLKGYLNSALTVLLLTCVATVVGALIFRWLAPASPRATAPSPPA
jgi:carbon starvation protein